VSYLETLISASTVKSMISLGMDETSLGMNVEFIYL
jgi:hypothetical protein